MYNVYVISTHRAEQLARALLDAVEANKVSEVVRLLGEGADPNHQWYWDDKDRRPPLHEACVNGNLTIIQLLVNAGADPNRSGGKFNMTPLHYACWSGHNAIVQYLIKDLKCKPGE